MKPESAQRASRTAAGWNLGRIGRGRSKPLQGYNAMEWGSIGQSTGGAAQGRTCSQNLVHLPRKLQKNQQNLGKITKLINNSSWKDLFYFSIFRNFGKITKIVENIRQIITQNFAKSSFNKILNFVYTILKTCSTFSIKMFHEKMGNFQQKKNRSTLQGFRKSVMSEKPIYLATG